jgi:hypothetical protein
MNDSIPPQAPKPSASEPAAKATPTHLHSGDGKPHDQPFLRTIKTFVTRAGRATSGQLRAIEDLGPRYVLPYSPEAIDLTAVFGPERASAPLILEIGFGMGEATAHIARLRPSDNFVCCEVHEAGVGALLKRMQDPPIENIRIVQHDALEVIDSAGICVSADPTSQARWLCALRHRLAALCPANVGRARCRGRLEKHQRPSRWLLHQTRLPAPDQI